MMTRLYSTALAAALCFLSALGATEKINCGEFTLEYFIPDKSEPTEIVICNVIHEPSDTHTSHALDLTTVSGLEIIGAMPSAFAFDQYISSVIIPASFATFQYPISIDESWAGKGTGSIPLAYNMNEAAFKLVVKVKNGGSTYNDSGSTLVASGTDPFANSFSTGFQIFLTRNGQIQATFAGGLAKTFSKKAGSDFTVYLYYNPTTKVLHLRAEYADGTNDEYMKEVSGLSVTDLCYGLPAGTSETLTLTDGAEPFEGCTSLMSIDLAPGNQAFIEGTGLNEGALLSATTKRVMVYPYGRLFNKPVRIRSTVDNRVLVANPSRSGKNTNFDNRTSFFGDSVQYAGPSLFRLVATDNGLCKILHLNSNCYEGRKSNSPDVNIDVVQSEQYSGDYEITLIPDHWPIPSFVFTEHYTDYQSAYAGAWSIVNDNGTAKFEKDPSSDSHNWHFEVPEVTKYSLAVNTIAGAPVGLATVSLPVAWELPDNAMAYTVIGFEAAGHQHLLSQRLEPGSRVEAGEGMLVKGEPGSTVTLRLAAPTAATQAAVANLLEANLIEWTNTPEALYVLSDNQFSLLSAGSGLGFNTAYLRKSSIPTAPTSVDVDDDVLTGVESISTDATEDAGPWTDLQGRRVDCPTLPGLYLRRGQKLIIR